MKILYISNFVKTYSLVFQNELSVLMKLGHEVEWAANFSKFIGKKEDIPVIIHDIPFKSNPFNFSNLKAYYRIKKILRQGQYDAIICSTPIGGTIGRLAGKREKVKKIIYCAHGFLFLKGINPFLYFLFKTHEKILAKVTDYMITITDEDYKSACDFKLRNNGKIFFVHGAGVNFDDIKEDITKRIEKRHELGIYDDSSFLLISAGYLNKNKNNKVVIEAISLLKNKNIFYIICGEGPYMEKLKKIAKKKKVEEQVIFLGYRTDVNDLMLACDAFVIPSFREGAPRSLLEAINANLPCIGSKTRGISDILQEGKCGLLCNPSSPKEFSIAIELMRTSEEKREEFVNCSKEIINDYSSEKVTTELFDIYSEIL